ncbi:ferrous iron transport protein A [Thermomonas sp. XSG]|nr:ferrous iron transport protein A [Thermomonas sp. XSG]
MLELRTIPICPCGAVSMRLTELPKRKPAVVEAVEEQAPNDPVARRLRELGFVAGEGVEVVAAGPLGAEPLLVQVGFTRFALRRAEAARVRLRASGSAV